MRWWPFGKSEKRSSAPYSDAILAELVRAAGGEVTVATATAAVEAAAGYWSRALAGATCSHPAVTPAYLACVGREIIRRGEALHEIRVDDMGMVSLVPVGHWDVWGESDRMTWWYNATINGPSTSHVRGLPYAAVVHHVWGVDPFAPWRGVSPLRYAGITGELLATVERKLADEAGGPVGSVLPIPADPGEDGENDDPLAPLKATLAKLRGKMAFVETTAAGWDQGQAVAPRQDWRQLRIGADPPAVLQALRNDTAMAILEACGVPVSLATDADGTSQRESWRRFVMGAVAPQAAGIANELSEKLEAEVTFSFDGLWAHDLVGRSQAVDKLVKAGVELAEARQLAGLS